MKIEIGKKDWNGYKLHDFLQFEITNNEALDEFHALIYMRLIWINNRAGWTDTINVPTEHTAKQSFCCVKTYRKKINELEKFGMIRILEKSKNQNVAALITLKTEKLQKTLMAMYLIREKSSAPGNLRAIANGQGEAPAREPEGYSKLPHIKRKGANATLSENEEAKRETETAQAVPLAEETGRYTRYGLPDTFKEEFFTFLQEQDVEKSNVHKVLLCSHNINVVRAVTSQYPIKKEEVEKTINVIVEFLQEHTSREGDETITALTLTPEEKLALKEDRD